MLKTFKPVHSLISVTIPNFLLMLRYLFFLFTLLYQLNLLAQTNTDSLYHPKEVGKLAIIDLYADDKSFPTSYLYGMSGDNLVLLTDVSSWREPPIYAKSKIRIEHYKYMTVTSRKEKIKNSLIWGTIIGSVSFYLSREMTRTQPGEQRVAKAITGQAGHDGIIPGFIGGVTGFGIGIVIGQHLSKRKVDLQNQKTSALRYLRDFNY